MNNVCAASVIQEKTINIPDVFEALTSTDRPYKPPLPIEKAFAILDDMVKAGDIDDEILSDFKYSGSWE